MTNAGGKEITLEAVLQHGEEALQDFQKFLPLWIRYLGDKTGRDAQRLIPEAVGLLNDSSQSAKYAEKYAAVHPGLYWALLTNGNGPDGEDRVSIGKAAMKAIPRKYTIRSRIALKTAEYAIEAKAEPSVLKACYFAAYESDTTAVNYIRALFHGYGTEQDRDALRKVLSASAVNERTNFYSALAGSGLRSEQEENKPDGNRLFLLRFLDGQFSEVLTEGLNQTKALGWSGTFMKQGIALFLLYLCEGRWAGKGMDAMASAVKKEMNFSAEEYRKGICESGGENEDELFYGLFSKWKSITPMEPDIRACAIKKITALLEKRIEGIMEANRRNYYGECAAYIAALGEVQESLGKAGAKQSLMTSYKFRYPRRRAFIEELRRYGWTDQKRK